MTSVKLAVSEPVWEQMLAMLDEPRESAAVLLAGQAHNREALTLAVNSAIPVPDEAYELRSPRELQIASRGWMPALRSAADGGWVGIFLHSHPRGRALASVRDEVVDAALAPAFRTRLDRQCYASMILGGTSAAPEFSGRLLQADRPPVAIGSLRSAGRRLRVLAAEDARAECEPIEVYDRQVRAFGSDGQRLLRRLHIGVAGAGGTGSAVLEQLVRLGVGTITLIDDDTLSESNVTRVHGSRLEDAGRPKVEVAREQLAAIDLGTELHAVDGNLTQRGVMERLRACDLVFGCTDDHAGRAVLSRLAYWYLIPVIDMGVLIASSEGRVRGIFARVTTATPGEPCLLCRGELDPARAREERYSEDERESLRREGYAQGLAERDPAVVPYTTMVAAHAVADMLARVFGFGRQPVPSKVLLDIGEARIRRQAGSPRAGCYCASPERWGRADSWTPLGMTWAG
jgi:molybdopterin/thiamine biosynthesis adenylyltransferase